MPTNSKFNENDVRIRAKTSDQNLLALAKRIAEAYENLPLGQVRDERVVGLLSKREVEQVKTGNVDTALKVLSKVPQMSAGQRLDFCDLFIGEDMSGLDLATPEILGDAYHAISDRVHDGEPGQQERLDKLAARIDELSADFANSGGMVVGQNEWPLVDTNNVADVYEGFTNMLNARMAEIDATKDPEKVAEMQANLLLMQNAIENYDDAWGLKNLGRENAEKLAEHWDELCGALNRAELSEETKTKLAKYKFLDSKGAVIPQFTSGKRGDTKKYEEYETGFRIAKEGRLASVVELARHDVAKKHVAEFYKGVDEEELEFEFNEQVLTKLFEFDSADKVIRAATENPEQFTDPKYREEFIKNLAHVGGEISDVGYNAAIEAQTNATAGWAARVKNKLGAAADRAKGFFGRVFQPIKHIDKMADVRMTRRSIDKREKRIEFFTRILKGFASGFIASALITTIATAAAAAAGVSVAMSLAAIGIVTAIGMGVIQVTRWRKAQEAAGLPTDINEFLKDKRLVASLGASLVAVVAMCFGAGGMATAAKWLGYGALAIGGSNNAAAAFRDARDAKMSAAESIAWAIANAGAVIGGGFAGRAAAHAGINAINKHYSHNTWFQNENTRTELQETTTTRDTTETRLEYTQDALDNAERISRMWYRDNPELLQQRVDAINAYNAEHGTNIDPYRAIMINGDAGGQTFDNMRLHVNNSQVDSNINDVHSGGHHRILTDWWANVRGVSHDVLDAARHLFDGPITEAKMNSIEQLDNLVSETNTVGDISGRPVQTDNYFKPNDPAGWTSYTDGNPAKVENVYPSQEIVTTTKPVGYTDYTPTKGDGMAAFGNYTPRERLTKLRDRVGSFLDRVRRNRQNESVSEDVPPVIRNDEPKDELPTFTLEETQETQEQQLPSIVLDERDEESRIPEEKTTSPARREYEAPKISLDRVFPKPLFDDDKGRLAELREKSQPQPEPIPQWRIEDLPTALPDPENRKYEPLPDFAFALTEDQAEHWNDLHKQLATVRAEMRNSFTRADKMLKLRKQANRLTNEINSFTMELGNPSAFEIEQALAEVDRRKKLQNLLRQYKNHMRREPKGSDAQEWQHMKWETESQKLLDKIADLGGEASLNDSNLRFAAPKFGRFEQKQAEVAQREMERQEQKRDVFVMPMREQPKEVEERRSTEPEEKKQHIDMSPKPFDFNDVNLRPKAFDFEHQKPDFENRYPRNKRWDIDTHTVPVPLMEIRGVTVKLLDITGHNNHVVWNVNRAMVVVDVNGLRIPFYFDGWDEYSETGVWRPVLTVDRKGRLYTNSNDSNSKELEDIGQALNKYLNGKDFVGRIDTLEQIDPNKIVNVVSKSVTTNDNNMIWYSNGSGESWQAVPHLVARFLREVESPDYNSPRGWERIKNTVDELRNGVGEIRDRVRWPFRRYRDKKYE